MLKGSIVALITPFKNDILNEDVYRKLIHYHIKNGTKGVVPGGTTGESPTLSHDEHKKIIEIAVQECNGKIPVSIEVLGPNHRPVQTTTDIARFWKES